MLKRNIALRVSGVAIGVTLSAVTGSHAATVPVSSSLDVIVKCRVLPDSSARLACYDTAASSIADLLNRKQIQVVDTETVRETRRSLFGFYLPRVPLFSGDRPDQQIDEIDATIARVRQIDQTQIELRMSDDALWRTTEAPDWGAPKPGSLVHIKRGLMGGYFLTFKGQRPIRGIRVG